MEEAMRAVSDRADFRIRWYPFQLNPSSTVEGVDKTKAFEKMKGGEKGFADYKAGLTAAGQALKPPINFSFGGKIGNTIDSHRVTSAAYKLGGGPLQDKLVEELFKNYFEEEKHISDPSVLAEACAKVGMKNAENFINSDEERDQVVQDMVQAVKVLNVQSVPHYLVDKKYAFAGAQEVENLVQMFEGILKLKEEEAAKAKL